MWIQVPSEPPGVLQFSVEIKGVLAMSQYLIFLLLTTNNGFR